MRKFQYVITKPVGIHHRPAIQLVQLAESLNSTVTVEKVGGNIAAATNFIPLLGLKVKQGDTVTVSVSFGDEEKNTSIVEHFFEDNL